jgi:hypothetical protein
MIDGLKCGGVEPAGNFVASIAKLLKFIDVFWVYLTIQ